MTTSETRKQVRRTSDEPPEMSLRTVWWFMAITFGLGWGIGALLFLFTDQIEALFGPVSGTNPVFILLVWSPAIAGVTLVWRHYGRKGVGSFLRRLTLWRMPSPWWVFLLLGIPAVKYLGAAFNGSAGDFPFSPWYGLLSAMAIAAVNRTGRRAGLAWCRLAALPTAVRAPLVRSDTGSVLGRVARPLLSPLGNPSERLELRAISTRRARSVGDHHSTVQRRPRQHPHGCPVPLPGQRSGMARCSTLGELPIRRRGNRCGDPEPRGDVDPHQRRHRRADSRHRRRHHSTKKRDDAHMRSDTQTTIAASPAPPPPPDQPSRSWFWPGIGIAVVGLVVGLVFGITSYQDSQEEIDTFARLSVPGAVTLQVDEPGQQVVYYEGDESVGIDDLVVGIIDPAGATVAVASYEGELIYETTDLTLGRAIASFDAAQTGAYAIEVIGVATGQITVGQSFSRLALPGILVGLAIAGLSLVAGFVLWLFGIVKR